MCVADIPPFFGLAFKVCRGIISSHQSARLTQVPLWIILFPLLFPFSAPLVRSILLIVRCEQRACGTA